MSEPRIPEPTDGLSTEKRYQVMAVSLALKLARLQLGPAAAWQLVEGRAHDLIRHEAEIVGIPMKDDQS